ncbi:hypothetical protein AVEN_31343-1 [Araneus ventricosus]|uniref:Uncharacterized protein n=1 Tax=Araneus ventricosus TaxID=182803 RepID=A0A4Y2F3N1_ARAVE|nr:hypothetical protein AVEN_31343-1 [Araneus ventricosus]
MERRLWGGKWSHLCHFELREAIQHKRLDMLSDAVIFLHDNAPNCSQNSRIAVKVQVRSLEPLQVAQIWPAIIIFLLSKIEGTLIFSKVLFRTMM